jgi:hypothetical protein
MANNQRRCGPYAHHEKFAENGRMYVFYKNGADNVTKFWQCDRRTIGCKARLHTVDAVVVKRVNDHNHDTNPARIEVHNLQQSLKRHAVESNTELPNQIINHELRNATAA